MNRNDHMTELSRDDTETQSNSMVGEHNADSPGKSKSLFAAADAAMLRCEGLSSSNHHVLTFTSNIHSLDPPRKRLFPPAVEKY